MPRTPIDPARARRRALERDKGHSLGLVEWAAELLALLPGEYADRPLPPPLAAPPGPDRVELYRARLEARQALFHPGDRVVRPGRP